jgi:SAM-dependent methyltransferase
MSDSKPASSAYESEARVATYLEMEWSDWLLFPTAEAAQQTAKPPAGPVLPSFYSNVVQFAARTVNLQGQRIRMCDVGGSTGRLIFEWLRQFSSTEEVVLLEPSEAFNWWSNALLLGRDSVESIPTVRFYGKPSSSNAIRLPPKADSFSPAKISIVCGDSSKLSRPDGYFDVVSCLNVADRVPKPREFLSDLQKMLKVDGHLILASPMDWRHNDGTTAKEDWFENLHELLPENSWRILNETDIEYACRLTNRQAVLYLSQVVVARRSQ